MDPSPRAFDPHTALRVLRGRWANVVMETAFGPFVQMVERMEKAFSEVRMARKQPRNMARVFRIRHSGRLLAYHNKVRASRPSVEYLQQTLDTVLALVNEVHPSYYEDVRDRFVDLLKRWTDALPPKLIGRDEEAILEYLDVMVEATEDCSLRMLDCEERLADAASPPRPSM